MLLKFKLASASALAAAVFASGVTPLPASDASRDGVSSWKNGSKGSKRAAGVFEGVYSLCQQRALIWVGADPGEENFTGEGEQLQIQKVDEGRYTAVLRDGILCESLGPDVDCADAAEAGGDGTTFRYYYFVAVQSFDKTKKNTLTFVSHYSTYLTSGGVEESLDAIGDKETSRMECKTLGGKLICDLETFFEFTRLPILPAAGVASAEWAKEELGC